MSVTEQILTVKESENRIVDLSSIPKLTEWENEPDTKKLQEDLEASKESHNAHIANVHRWRNLHKVEGSARPKKRQGRSAIQPKLIRRQAEWRYSALSEPFLSSEKLFSVSPTTFEDQEAAHQNELVLNWQFRTKLNRVRLIDEYVRCNTDEGSVIVKLGWSRITKPETIKVPTFQHIEPSTEEEMAALEAAIMLKEENPRGYDEEVSEALKAAVDFFEESGQPSVAIQIGFTEQVEQKIIDNRPIIDILNPENVFIDPSCGGDLSKAHFVVLSFETSKAELLREPDRYKNLDHVNWEASDILATPDHETQTPQTFNFKDALRKRIVAYEYWGFYDIYGNNELVPIVATWIGNVMIRMELNPFPDEKLPFVVVNYMPIKRELMGEPDAEILEDNQKVLGAVTRGMIDLLGRSANGQQGFAKGMLDTLNRRRYESGQDYDFNPTVHPTNGIIEHKYPEIPNSAMNMLMLQNQEAESITGVKSFAGGMSGEAYGDVAAGIRGVLDAASKREMSILRRLAKGLTDIGNKIMAMNAVFLSEKEVVRVTNTQFVEIKREDLKGNFDLEVDISTAEIDNNKAQDLGFMLQTIGNNMDFGIVQIILQEIARLKRMPVLAEKIARFKPTPDPITEQLKQLEVMAKQKEIEKLDSEIALNNAKAQEVTTKANQNDLDTIEQETGTKHEREMDKQRGQSQGNQNLKVTEALLRSKKPEESDPDVEAAVGFNALSKGGDIAANIGSFGNRDIAAQNDPRLSIGSKYFDPSLDPASNPNIRV